MGKKQRIGFMIKQLSIAHEQQLNMMLKEHDLTLSQVRVLTYLYRLDRQKADVNQRDIEHHLDISNPTVTGILNRLESKDLVIRSTSERDARAKHIKPTLKAYELEKVIHKDFNQMNMRLFEGFDLDEQRQVMEYLNRMLRNIS